ncbi:hypothetical protein CFP65_5333 [Kitasatospora sp. MMS16-BH015]|uniref:hypothetical protein n=1 Tax=Kitasatospora sp. MMS16-BH015 TaxID=2018025 RepID=UPI000CA3BA2D|nr:hypothetical protein [Kitasatospora sp. MMS16-BH015]AUG80041.1 hypothetical protein CFP65_5333 [Kitasatospora sp. MMS16-BH015]
MTTNTSLPLADSGEAADLVAFLTRLLRFDRAAAVRLQAVAGGGGADPVGADGVVAVFGRLPLGSTGALAIRTARLARFDSAVDLTVSAGQLLEGVDTEAAELRLPAPVTGPSWAGLLPPRAGWELVGEPAALAVAPEVTAAVREFRERSEAVPEHHRTRTVLDGLADEIWARPLAAQPELPLRAAHAAYVIGFLTPQSTLTVHRAGAWRRLSCPAGSIAVRSTAALGAGLGLTPLR